MLRNCANPNPNDFGSKWFWPLDQYVLNYTQS